MAAPNILWVVVRWRWTPFFALVGSSLLYVIVVLLLVPSQLGRTATSKAGELVVVGNDSSPVTATVGGSPRRPRDPAPRSQPPAVAPPPPPPMPERFPESPPMGQMEAPPMPPPPEPPPPQGANEEEEEEEEDDDGDENEEGEQGAVEPPSRRDRALAGALRVMPLGARESAGPGPGLNDEP
jgi:hypothetical protein